MKIFTLSTWELRVFFAIAGSSVGYYIIVFVEKKTQYTCNLHVILVDLPLSSFDSYMPVTCMSRIYEGLLQKNYEMLNAIFCKFLREK